MRGRMAGSELSLLSPRPIYTKGNEPNQIGVLLRDRDRVVRPAGTSRSAAAGVRPRLRGLGRGGGSGSTSVTAEGGGEGIGGGTMGAGVGMARV
jgi:hypothetical protein